MGIVSPRGLPKEEEAAKLDQLVTGLIEPDGNQLLEAVRGQAAAQLERQGLPTVRDELFRHFPLRQFYAKQLVVAQPPKSKPSLPPCEKGYGRLVFVNGHFVPAWSDWHLLPKELMIQPLEEAFVSYGAFLSNQFQRSLKGETDPMALINGAYFGRGAFIYLPANCCSDVPLELLSVVDTGEETALVLPRLHLFMGANSQLQLVQREHLLSGKGSVLMRSVEAQLDPSSHLSLLQLKGDREADRWSFDTFRAVLKANSFVDGVEVVRGGGCSRWDGRLLLQGEGAHADLAGLALLEGKSQAHVDLLIRHAAPDCPSRQLFKNLLRGASRSSFQGKIYVEREAQKTDAFQLNNNLLLSDEARAYSQPNLEIFADDVKASHGSTAGALDDEQLFYLCARGLEPRSAESMLIEAFCRQLMDRIRLPLFAEEVAASVREYAALGS